MVSVAHIQTGDAHALIREPEQLFPVPSGRPDGTHHLFDKHPQPNPNQNNESHPLQYRTPQTQAHACRLYMRFMYGRWPNTTVAAVRVCNCGSGAPAKLQSASCRYDHMRHACVTPTCMHTNQEGADGSLPRITSASRLRSLDRGTNPTLVFRNDPGRLSFSWNLCRGSLPHFDHSSRHIDQGISTKSSRCWRRSQGKLNTCTQELRGNMQQLYLSSILPWRRNSLGS